MNKQQASGVGPLDPLTKASLVVAALMIVGAVVWWFVAHGRDEFEISPRGGYVVKWVQSFRSEIQNVADDPHADDAKLRATLRRIEDEQHKWVGYSTESDIRALKARIEARLGELQRK